MVLWEKRDSSRQWGGIMKRKAKSKGLREKRASRGHRVGIIIKLGKLGQGQSKGIFKKVESEKFPKLQKTSREWVKNKPLRTKIINKKFGYCALYEISEKVINFGTLDSTKTVLPEKTLLFIW